MRKLVFGALTATVLGALAAAPAAAQDAASYPDKPVTFIVGFSAGGGTDTVARIVAEAVRKEWGQAAVVENHEGAGGQIAASLVAKADPDGYTLLFDSASFTLRPALEPNLPYDAAKDFVPVTLASSAPYVLAVNPDVPAKTVGELIALAKEKPGELNYASAGVGSSLHLAAELFKSLAGVDIVHVPYKGAAGIPDLLEGRVQLAFAGLPQSLPHIKSGALRALAVTTTERSPQLPDVPTMQEAGVDGYEMGAWYGLFAPAGTPKAIIDKVAADVGEALKDPAVREQLEGQGLEPVGTSPDSFGPYVTDEIAKWTKLVADAGIKIE
jgi:tripartite-type tricarboxylate transporter receptor subunit TctC